MIPDPADYFIRGESEMHRAPTSGGLTLARFQMVGIRDQAVPSGESVICEFEDPEDETDPRQMDPYSLRSTTTLDGGGFGTIAIGDAILMTAELAGTWQVSVLRKMLSSVFWDVSGIYMAVHGGFLNRNGPVEQSYGNVLDKWEMGNFTDPAQGFHRFTTLSATHLIDLAAGDYLWADANAATSDFSDSTLEKVVLTGIRVGPLPAEPS